MHGYTPLTPLETKTVAYRLVPSCIIVSVGHHGRRYYFAFSSDLVSLCQGHDFFEVDREARKKGHAPVSPNSLAAAMIRDNFRRAGYSIEEEQDEGLV